MERQQQSLFKKGIEKKVLHKKKSPNHYGENLSIILLRNSPKIPNPKSAVKQVGLSGTVCGNHRVLRDEEQSLLN